MTIAATPTCHDRHVTDNGWSSSKTISTTDTALILHAFKWDTTIQNTCGGRGATAERHILDDSRWEYADYDDGIVGAEAAATRAACRAGILKPTHN